MRSFWDNIYFGNTVQTWLIAIVLLVTCIIAIRILKGVVLSRLRAWSQRTATDIDDILVEMIERSGLPFLYIASVYFAIDLLTLPPKIAKVIHIAFLFAATFYIIRIISALARRSLYSFIRKRTNNPEKQKEAKGIIIIVNIIIWILGIVFLVDNLGYDVTTIVAGLGIGGIAIALAAQTILGDLFSYFVIFFDRPFEIGDFIVVEDKAGVVEYIGIKTTRVRTLGGEELICSNTYLTNSRVHNYKRMQERRVLFKLGVTYQTPQGQLQRIPGMIKDIISAKDTVRFDRGHFSAFGDSSLDFEFVYYVLDPDYNTYMDIQQSVYFDIVAAFEAEGIEFAYPTRSLFIHQENMAPPIEN